MLRPYFLFTFLIYLNRSGGGGEVEAVVFDHGVREELVADAIELGLGGGFAVGGEGDFNVFANSHLFDVVVAHVFESRLDGGSGGVEDGGAQGDVNFGVIGLRHDRSRIKERILFCHSHGLSRLTRRSKRAEIS